MKLQAIENRCGRSSEILSMRHYNDNLDFRRNISEVEEE